MIFKIDKRYIAIQSLKAIVAYIIGVLIVFTCLDVEDTLGFVGTTLVVCIILFFIFFYPKNILVKDGVIRFKKKNSFKRIKVDLTDIAHVESKSKLYNTVTIKTKSCHTYKLHPNETEKLESVIRSNK